MRREKRLKPGEIVPVDVALSPLAMLFPRGDEMVVTAAAFRYPLFLPFTCGEFKVPFPTDGLTFPPDRPGDVRGFGGGKEADATRLGTTPPPTRNRGRHIVHCGGRYDSRLSFSDVPPA